MQPLDEYDKKLLQLVQENNKMTTQELGDLVNLSGSAVQRRLTRLRENKIIEADISIISPSVIGLTITCVVDIILEDGNSKALEKFKASMRKCNEVMQCYFVTGTYDFVIIVNAENMQHYESFAKKWLMDNPNVKHFYTHVIMDKVKVGYNVTI
ncbi:Lrp/AsnC family transcriptional regulator [Flavobacterium collinsii]|uniref:DNA-binding transcriptional activator DecR n=1 Tax=Flavobacterium collinsii TaxID=1114861 RepID=A0ABM8KLD2_9FLAO|nr:Lrp/AsnC family transcriptional regulator [Flavobacterium collinsii]CAA9200467.1 DNA-binding transcriptional activator DecR [Flavobacterium collinsii]